jgi:hypothetical protein
MHFELLGWSETQIVQRFWLIGLMAALVGIGLVTSVEISNWRFVISNCKSPIPNYQLRITNNDWTNTRTLILGAARQGLALARWLARHASNVTVSDSRSASDLASAQASLADVNVTWALGGHPLELLNNTDVLCLSGGVPLTLPIVQEAIQRGIPLSNDSQIFMEVAPCKTIGITGSAGKTTTTTLVGEMAKLDHCRQCGRRITMAESIRRPSDPYAFCVYWRQHR